MLARIFANAIARRVAYVLVAAVLAWCGLGDAHAVTKAQAMSACQAEATAFPHTDVGLGLTYSIKTPCAGYNGTDWLMGQGVCTTPRAHPTKGTVCAEKQRCSINNPSNCASEGTIQHSWDYKVCTAPTTYDPDTDTCRNMPQECAQKAADQGVNTTTEIYTGDKCVGGCTWGRKNAGTSTVNGVSITWGDIGYTGATCTAPNVPEPPKEDKKCTPGGGGQTFCVKDDGKHCYSASTGKMICWTPGETGTKTDGNVAQVRKPGGPPVTPPTPPPGETFNDGNNNTTTNTTTPGGTVINNTVNNYTTGNGTDAGSGNDGEDIDGEDEGDDGSASGGEGCDAPPVCSGGDAIGCATLIQVWRNRCSPNNNKITGGGECDANGNPLLVCTGDQIQCAQALYQAEEYCQGKMSDANNDGHPDWMNSGDGDGTEGAGEDPGEDVGKVQTATFGAPMLDESGLSWSRSCPTLPTINMAYFGTIDLGAQPWLCDFTALVRMALFLVGSFLALLIVMGWKS